MNDVFANQIVLSTLSVWAIQKLKAWSGLPIVHETSDKLNSILSAILATLSAAGILVTVTWSGFSTGEFHMIVTGLTVPNIVNFLWLVLRGFVMNEAFYKAHKRLVATAG